MLQAVHTQTTAEETDEYRMLIPPLGPMKSQLQLLHFPSTNV
jgi:hypothetical protein